MCAKRARRGRSPPASRSDARAPAGRCRRARSARPSRGCRPCAGDASTERQAPAIARVRRSRPHGQPEGFEDNRSTSQPASHISLLSHRSGGQTMTRSRARTIALAAAVALVAATQASAQSASAPSGYMTWASHVALAPTWFDPAETSGIITPFMVLYALHDALVKPMPGNAMAPSLAESWTMSKDGLTYEFVLRKGIKFHNGETMTAEDVKFS